VDVTVVLVKVATPVTLMYSFTVVFVIRLMVYFVVVVVFT
jgi:hypothetical protein